MSKETKYKVKFGATIPVAQYANLMPEIDMGEVGMEEAEKGLDYIKSMFARFSEKGALNEKEVKEMIRQTISKKSFNEDIEVQYDPIAHTSTFKNKPLEHVTRYIDKFYKKFDSQKMSEVSAKAWGVEQGQVSDLWDSNGKLSSSFGTVVHNAIEFYLKFKDVGQAISDKKGLDYNYALPKHPILRSIIEGFIAIDKSKFQVLPEVFLTDVENGICGSADGVEIIDLENKICRITEYKVNVNSEEIDRNSKALAPFNLLPANKITKYQIQDSVYANMLQKRGWTVEGIDIYVYEDEWKHFEVEVLKVIE